MIDNYKNKKAIADLRQLNFGSLITIGVPDVASYTFAEYKKNGYEHKPINGYCVSCEDKRCNVAPADASYQLTNISHGAHSSDFLSALKDTPDTTGWHPEPIVFVYETPSLDYGIYKDMDYKGHQKRPAKQWYWIHEDQEMVSYPDRFCGGQYGGFVLSAMYTFKLANVYVTNLVKCAMNKWEHGKEKFKGLQSYKEETVENCWENYLSQEISYMKPKIIFAVGANVERWVRHFVEERFTVQQLPHPAHRSSGFRNEHYKAIYFWVIARALHKAGIIDTSDGSELAKMYLEKYDQ